MRWLIDTIRSAFCKHDWEVEVLESSMLHGQKMYETCKKCRWHRTYWKK